jgi:hypothetical protein
MIACDSERQRCDVVLSAQGSSRRMDSKPQYNTDSRDRLVGTLITDLRSETNAENELL